MTEVQITGATWPAYRTQRLGPFLDGSGNLWMVASWYDGTSSTYPAAFESTDGGATWTKIAHWTNVGLTGNTNHAYLDCAFDSTGGAIYIIAPSSTGNLQIGKFTISTATWAIVNSTSGPAVQPDLNSQTPAFICRQSTGAFVIVYQGPTASSMGTSYRQVYYVTCTSAGAFGTATLFFGNSASAEHIDLKCAVTGASDAIHVVMASALGNLYRRSLISGALNTSGFITPSSSPDAVYFGIFYDPNLPSTANVIHGATVSGGMNPYRRQSSSSTETWTADSNSISDSPSTCNTAFVYDSVGSKLYAVFSDVTQHVSIASATGTTWGATIYVDATVSTSGPIAISATKISGAIGIVMLDFSNVYFSKYSTVPTVPLVPDQLRRKPVQAVKGRVAAGRF